jgi:hypothetical protein
MFAESRLWKCEAFGANDSLRASSRTHTIGQIRSLPENPKICEDRSLKCCGLATVAVRSLLNHLVGT